MIIKVKDWSGKRLVFCENFMSTETSCPLILTILIGNEILISIKDRNSCKFAKLMQTDHPNLGLVNIDLHIKVIQFLSIGSQDIKRKRYNLHIHKGNKYRN